MSAFYSTIFIPAYDHAREVENMRVTLARWNAQAFGSKPHPPHVAYYDTIAGQPLCASFQNIQLNETQQSTGLSRLSALPEEVLSKILALLEPQDLLKMSRLSKRLRRKLMSRKSQPIWTSSLQNAPHDVPPCPPFMSEPHYVALLFAPTDCMGCGAPDSVHPSIALGYPSLALGWQLCPRCTSLNVLSLEEVENRFKHVLQPHGLLEHPFFCKWYPYNVLAHFHTGCPEWYGIHSEYFFYEPEVNLFLTEYVPLIIRLIRRGQPAEDMLRLLVNNRLEFVQAIQFFAGEVQAWRIRRDWSS
ncbi:hypothetical protein ACG7TL_008138 [Trametes sanguinea]